MPILLSEYILTNNPDHVNLGRNPGSDVIRNSNGFLTPDNGINYELDTAEFRLLKTFSPTGNAVAKIYSDNGGEPGTILATSDNFDVSTLTGSYSFVEFSFSGAQRITLSPNTLYHVSVEYSNGDTSNYVRNSVNIADVTYQDHYYITSWVEYSAAVVNYKVYGISAVSYAISGVVSLAGVPVEGAIVRCIKQSDNTILTQQTTDSTGAYSFSDLDSEELYHLAVEYQSGEDKYNALSYWDIVPVEV